MFPAVGYLPYRKFRKELEKYKNNGVVEEIKDQYIDSVTRWFNPDMDPF